jgi:hypothetical protein
MIDKKREIELKKQSANEPSVARGVQPQTKTLLKALSFRSELSEIDRQLQMMNVYDFVAERCEITLREQFVSRRDMFQLIQMLHNRTVYKNNPI